jgi:cytochrome P450
MPWEVREGDRVVLAPVLTHMSPDIYPDPSAFSHARFLPSPEGAKPESGGLPASVALQPFGGGCSMCPGRFLALNEIRSFLAQLATRWEVPSTPSLISPRK